MMKKNFRRLVCGMVIIAMMLSMTGCTTYNNFKAAFFPAAQLASNEPTIKIGVYEAMTGQKSSQGKEEVMGIELAHELYPTVLGMPVELVYSDNQSNIYVAESAIQELLAKKPSVVLGSCGETVTLIASDYIKAANTPAITISATNPLITANNEFYFSATFTETRQGDALADFAYTGKKKEVVTSVKMYNDDFATETIKRFTNRMKKLTGDSKCVVGGYNVTLDTTDYTRIIEAIRESGAGAVFLDLPPTVAKDFLQQAIDLEMTHILWLGTREWNDEDFLTFVRSQEKLNIAYSSDFSQDVTTAMSAEFLQAYKEKYGADAEPSEAAAVAFDAYLLAISAIARAQDVVMTTTLDDLQEKYSESDAALRGAIAELDQAKMTGVPTGRHIRMALEKIKDFAGASGMISYNGKNEATKTITINEISGGVDLPAYNVG